MAKKIVLGLALIGFVFSAGLVSAQGLNDLNLVTEQYPPYNFEQDGNLQGISIDYLVQALQQAGSDLGRSDIRLLPWAKGYDMALNQPGTLLFATTRTEQREELFKWAGPIAPTKISLVAKKDSNVRIDNLSDIMDKDYTIGVIRDDVGEQLLKEGGVPDGNIDAVAKAVLNIKKLDRGRIDAWAYEENVAMWLIKSNGFDPGNFEPVYELEKAELFYAFHKDTPQDTVNKLQNALDAVKQGGKYDQILDTYR
ncbi:MAG: substrate-binding periplasmic protein [Thermodesulfobacteriota bacterium]